MGIKGVDYIETGENIKRLMRRNKVTTFDLMMALKLTSASTIYSWTQGRYAPNADNLVRLAQIFKCPIDDILVAEKEKNDG